MTLRTATATLLLAGLFAVPAAPAWAAPAAQAEQPEPTARVTVVTRGAHGSLSFATERVARSQARGRALHWRKQAGVIAADVEHRVQVAGDPLRADQWGLTVLRATQVQAAGDARGQVIAVVDSGVDATHPDLAGVVLPGTDLVSAGDGRLDLNGHGTHVAGIAAAVNNNDIGGAGLATGAAILPVRVIGADGSGTDGDAARGVVWAVDHGATVINLSFGGPDRSSVMDSAVRYALSRGVPVVAAAGNEGQRGDPVLYPAATAGVISVAAVDANGVRPLWSSTGDTVGLAAPGVGIVSTLPGGGYSSWSGTSMAAPFVAASVALLRRAQPALDPAALRARLTSTADDLGGAGFDREYGYGRVNLFAAEGLIEPAPAPTPTAPAPDAAATAPAPVAPTSPDPAATAPPPETAPAALVSPAVVVVRISTNRTIVGYRGLVTVSTRTLAVANIAPAAAVRLERLVAGRWTTIRTGITGSDGLLGWQLRPDRTSDYRVRSGSVLSPLRRILVRTT